MPDLLTADHMFDIALIFISGFAVFYCWLLSRRLKNLQNLETGLGGSIVSLTDAIKKTNQAAMEARASTVETVKTLKKLLREAEDTLPQVEAKLESLRNSQRGAKAASQSLLQIVTELKKLEANKAASKSRKGKSA